MTNNESSLATDGSSCGRREGQDEVNEVGACDGPHMDREFVGVSRQKDADVAELEFSLISTCAASFESRTLDHFSKAKFLARGGRCFLAGCAGLSHLRYRREELCA